MDGEKEKLPILDRKNIKVGISINDGHGVDFTKLILNRQKTVETRPSRTLDPFIGEWVGLVRTGRGKATLVGYVMLGEPTRYNDSDNKMENDYNSHLVPKTNKLFKDGIKYAYPIIGVERIEPIRLDKYIPVTAYRNRNGETFRVAGRVARDISYINEIKENKIYMNTKKYDKEFSNYLGIMKEALERENFEAYDAAKEMLEESIDERKHEKALAEQLDTTNFGVLNHIFEERLPELFKKDKKAVRDVMKTIKEDKNLMGEFNYYNAIRQYKGKITESIPSDTVLDKLNEAVINSIDKNKVIASNKKLRRVMKEHNIIPNDFIDEEMMKLYESGHNLLTKDNGIKNVVVIAESVNSIRDYMDRHKNDVIKEQIDPDKLIKEFKERLKDTLTESEMSFVKEITDWRSPIAEQRKEKLFNKFKNECIDKVNDMLKEDAGNVELENLKKQLEEQKFNKDSIVQDIAKLLEIRDILLDR